MPSWLLPVLTAILGSGVLGVFVGHKLQERRERLARALQAREDWIARQRGTCGAVLDGAIKLRQALHVIEPVHDNLSSRLVSGKSLQFAFNLVTQAGEDFQRARRELVLEPNDPVQRAVEIFGEAGTAYQDALTKPMRSPLNPVQMLIGKTPPAELDRLRQAWDAAMAELERTIRDYLATLDQPAKPIRRWGLSRHKDRAVRAADTNFRRW